MIKNYIIIGIDLYKIKDEYIKRWDKYYEPWIRS